MAKKIAFVAAVVIALNWAAKYSGTVASVVGK